MLQHIPVLSAYDTGNGVCRYLVNNLCSIYENRPLICKVEEMYFSFFSDKMTEQDFVRLNIEACAKIADYFAESI
jgi:Fe-S-cluster containining protein